jgi:hypothetical protein
LRLERIEHVQKYFTKFNNEQKKLKKQIFEKMDYQFFLF